MKTLYPFLFVCLCSICSTAQTTSPDSPKVLPDTSTNQNRSGALYRSPNDSLKRPSAVIATNDTTLYTKEEAKDSSFKDQKTVKYRKQPALVKYPANKKEKGSPRQNESTKKKGLSQ